MAEAKNLGKRKTVQLFKSSTVSFSPTTIGFKSNKDKASNTHPIHCLAFTCLLLIHLFTMSDHHDETDVGVGCCENVHHVPGAIVATVHHQDYNDLARPTAMGIATSVSNSQRMTEMNRNTTREDLLNSLPDILCPADSHTPNNEAAHVRLRGDFEANYPVFLRRKGGHSMQAYRHHSVMSMQDARDLPENTSCERVLGSGGLKGDIGCYVVLHLDIYSGCYDNPNHYNERAGYRAIKRLDSAYVLNQPLLGHPVVNEIHRLKELGNGRHVIRLEEALVDDLGNLFVVTNFCSSSLVDHIRPLHFIPSRQFMQQQLEASARITYRQMLRAIDYIHTKPPNKEGILPSKRQRDGAEVPYKGVAHLNISPDHFLIDDSGYLLLTNFALSQCIPDNGLIAVHSMWPGNPEYMSPEMAEAVGGTCTFDPVKSDVWAISVILFNILVGSELYFTPKCHDDPRFKFFLVCGFLWEDVDPETLRTALEEFSPGLKETMLRIHQDFVQKFSPELKMLFKNVFNLHEPECRLGVKEILQSDWMQKTEVQQEPAPLSDMEEEALLQRLVNEPAAPQAPAENNVAPYLPQVVHPHPDSNPEALECARDGCGSRPVEGYRFCMNDNCREKGCQNGKMGNFPYCRQHKCNIEGCGGNRREEKKTCCSECHQKRLAARYGRSIEIPEGVNPLDFFHNDALNLRGAKGNVHPGNQRLITMGRDLIETHPDWSNQQLNNRLLCDFRLQGGRFICRLDNFATDLGGGEHTYTGWYECNNEGSNKVALKRCQQRIRDDRRPRNPWILNGRIDANGARVDLNPRLQELAGILVQQTPNADETALAETLRTSFQNEGSLFLRKVGEEFSDSSPEIATVRCLHAIRRARNNNNN